MQSRSYLFLLGVVALTALSAWLFTIRPYNYGLDIRGGVRFTYQMKPTEEQKKDLAGIRSRLITVMERRVGSTLGVVEGNVQPKGIDQFIVEIPGYKNVEEAQKVISSTAKIKAYWARNIQTEKNAYRTYSVARENRDSADPTVSFTRRGSNETIKYGSPEYQRIIDGWELILEGDELKQATELTVGAQIYPQMFFSASGAEKMERWSKRVYNQRENLAFVLDGQVISIAPLQENTTLSDNAYIQGTFTPRYVANLTSLLNAGALPVDLVQIRSESIDPTVGTQALNLIIKAGIIAFAAIALFLIAYYVFPGFVALIALVLYVLFTLTALKLINATFSLAAIAGFILSVGMAVDANILVFERVKEEMRAGKKLHNAVALGFRRALPAIVDSNACTILTSIVLYNLGTGAVKGFATSLIIGVAISLFTAVTVTRSLLVFLVDSGLGADPKWYGLKRQWFGEGLELSADKKPLKIVEHSKRYFIISLLTIIPGVIFWAMGGLKLNVEFQGGYEASYYVKPNSNITPTQVSANLQKAGFLGSNVKSSGEQNLIYVTVPILKDDKGETPELKQKIAEGAGFTVQDQRSFDRVGPSVQQETVTNAILGIIYGSALIILYLAVRFGFGLGGFVIGLRFAMAAIGALIHDILVVLGFSAIVGFLLNWEISALYITAMLTVIGFSTHDTIVIFDRIRENLRKGPGQQDLGFLMNVSITQSFARSLNTSMTVVATLIILIGFGTATIDLKFFCATMLVGIISGTYSSIFNASPILYLYDRYIVRKKGENAGLVGHAIAEHQYRLIAASTAGATEGPAFRDPQGQSFGQVKRKESPSAKKKGEIEIDE